MISQLTSRIWYSHPVEAGDRPTLGIISGDNASLLVDGGNSPAHVKELIDFSKNLSIAPLKAIVLTHWHWDHTFGACSTGLPVICCEKTAEKIKWMQNQEWTDEAIFERVKNGSEMEFCRQNILIEWPDNDRNIIIASPTVVFKQCLVLDLGGLSVSITAVENDHSSDGCVIFAKQEKTAFLGDCLYLNMDSEPWYRTAKKTREMIRSLLALDADWYVPAHHGIYSGAEFKTFAEEMLLMCDAAEDADSVSDAEDKLRYLTKRELDDAQRQGLAEFINAREHCI